MFITYWFIVFAAIFFAGYWLVPVPTFRKYWLLVACLTFHYRFAGPAGVTPIIILGILAYFSGRSNNPHFRLFTIVLCVLALVFYKYTAFIITQMIGVFDASAAKHLLDKAESSILPAAPPLAISFFVFEFVHYLIDIQRGKQPIKSPVDFTLFSVFWPSVVSGPVKRFDQFLPSLKSGCQKVNLLDIQVGTMRIIMGLVKKLVIADNLTAYIDYVQPQFAQIYLKERWLLLFIISLRILFDFSGYSDIAIGFARLMGIKLPENFSWPYLATNLQEFWRRWHISLSTWIRDYIYVPLGGNQHGLVRKASNGVIAFGICGLWHGAAWHFIFWGLFHGIGLLVFTQVKSLFSQSKSILTNNPVMSITGWGVTYLYVCIGWLYFFYPVQEANSMLMLLFKAQ